MRAARALRLCALMGGAALCYAAASAGAPPRPLAPCPRLEKAHDLPLRAGGRPLRADVDGDGVRDRVTIRLAGKAPDNCGFLLLVEARKRRYAARVPQGTKWSFPIRASETSAMYPEPYVDFTVPIQRRGLVIAVAQQHGASNVSGSLYALVHSRLQRLEFPQRHGFWYAGSLAASQTFDCYRRGRSGAIVATARWPSRRPGWWFRRSVLRLDGARFRVVRTHVLKVSPAVGGRLSERWHVSYGLFRSCTASRNGRGP